MNTDAMAERAKDIVAGIIKDDTINDTDKMHLLNYLKALSDVVLVEIMRFYEGDATDGKNG